MGWGEIFIIISNFYRKLTSLLIDIHSVSESGRESAEKLFFFFRETFLKSNKGRSDFDGM